MIKIKCIDHIDDFGNDKVFTIVLQEVSLYKNRAMKIDKENYSSDCFGLIVNYDADENEYCICQDEFDCEIFYVDNNGDKHWFNYKLSEDEANEIIECCKNDTV